MNIVPITVPMINIANTPLDSGELNPYLSTTTATLGSRPIEFVIPIDSFLNPNSNATGSTRIVARCPSSCNINAGPISNIRLIDWPLETASFAINTPMNSIIAPSAIRACFLCIHFIGFAR